MRMRMTLKFNEELANENGVDIDQYKEIIRHIFAEEGIIKDKNGDFIAPDINKDYYPNFGKALRKIASYEWAYVYLKEWTWNANYYHDNVLNTLKKYKNYLCEKSAN